MPAEKRTICFTNDEVADALERFARATKHPMPQGKITACKIESGGALFATLTIQHMAEGSTQTARFDKNSIAAALIRYCIEKKIPVPKSAEKFVEAQNSGVTLIMNIGEACQGAAA